MTRPLSVSQQLQQNSRIVFTTLLVSVPLDPASELQSNYNPTYLVENPGIDLRTSRKPWSVNPNIVEIQLKEEFQSTPESLSTSCSLKGVAVKLQSNIFGGESVEELKTRT